MPLVLSHDRKMLSFVKNMYFATIYECQKLSICVLQCIVCRHGFFHWHSQVNSSFEFRIKETSFLNRNTYTFTHHCYFTPVIPNTLTDHFNLWNFASKFSCWDFPRSSFWAVLKGAAPAPIPPVTWSWKV